MNTHPKASPEDFPFVQGKDLPYALTSFQLMRLRDKLQQGIYWIQPERRVLWNKVLIIDYILNGKDNSGHQELIDQYTASLPVAVRRSTS
jgi:hypothetical protein